MFTLREQDRFLGKRVAVGEMESAFALGDEVVPALAVGPDAVRGVIIGIIVNPHGFVYAVAWPGKDVDTRHYAIELVTAD